MKIDRDSYDCGKIGGARWMSVDDNEELLQVIAAMLREITEARIECFASPLAALGAFAANPGAYDLVVTDSEMPGMDGVGLCRRMLGIFPTQKIVLATGSGFFTEAVARHAGFSGLLNKPFSISALKEALAWVELDNPAALAA